VRFLGVVSREELPVLYQSARVFVLPSLQENQPMVLIEAMAGGCAVVTTSAPGCAEAVGNAAVPVEPGSSEALERVLTRLLADEAEIERMRAASRIDVQRFASAHIARNFEQLFRGSVRRRDRPRSAAAAATARLLRYNKQSSPGRFRRKADHEALH
jgi:glycosyltransferase involved in cell wall biosynthesis